MSLLYYLSYDTELFNSTFNKRGTGISNNNEKAFPKWWRGA